MLSPDACLIVLFTVLTLVWYLFWVLDAVPRARTLLVVLAVVALVASIVVHDVETAKVAAQDTGASAASSGGNRGAANPA